jgi:hypothetical protein
VNDYQIGFMGLVIFVTHPFTWIIVYGGLEGSVRLLSAAVGENCLGIVPLYLADRIFLKVTGRSLPRVEQEARFKRGNVASYLEAAIEKFSEIGSSPLADEIIVQRENGEEFLEIHACRRKPGWEASFSGWKNSTRV